MRARELALVGFVACGERAAEAPVVTVPTVSPQPSPPSPVAAASTHRAPEVAVDEHFRMSIEQDGREVSLSDGGVEIARRPFAVVVRFAEPGSLMLNVSSQARWYLLAGTGGNRAELDAVVGPGHGMAEPDPPDRDLIVSDEASHYLFFQSDQQHRCHEVEHDGAVIVCRRVVKQLATADPQRAVDVARWTGTSLYLVAIMNAPGSGLGPELQRARMQISFR